MTVDDADKEATIFIHTPQNFIAGKAELLERRPMCQYPWDSSQAPA
ncbi:MAG: hypothetical protein ACK5TR_05295 [Alphaproteobacteria bacterium]|jgi:hypothetical protein